MCGKKLSRGLVPVRFNMDYVAGCLVFSCVLAAWRPPACLAGVETERKEWLEQRMKRGENIQYIYSRVQLSYLRGI